MSRQYASSDMPEQRGTSGHDSQPLPNSQAPATRRLKVPAWMQELPRLRFTPEEPDVKAPLVDPVELETLLADVDPQVVARVKEDIRFLEYELLRLFRQRDHAAKKHQNRYRKYQLAFVLLASLATLIGSLQALSLASNPQIMPVFAFGETVVALLATFLATISGRESPMPLWITNRRRAEQLRREYFRYLANLPPYDEVEGYRRAMLLSRRAAEINRGDFPQDRVS
ncbi:MAG: DUF4231 domain-containing protein [Chloroflexota bacterium]|nr:MAG: hypothetical protein DIU68_09965 [Chloroflexota bacterium]